MLLVCRYNFRWFCFYKKAVAVPPYSVFVFCVFRLLQNKPEAARKALSENSLLKNINFNEKFLGEETITESKMSFLYNLISSDSEKIVQVHPSLKKYLQCFYI